MVLSFFHRQAKSRVRKYIMYCSVIFVCDASRDASKSALILIYAKKNHKRKGSIININLILLLAFAFCSVYLDCKLFAITDNMFVLASFIKTMDALVKIFWPVYSNSQFIAIT